jgi:hypothetical protein
MAGVLGTILFLWPVLLIGGVLYFGRNFLLAWIKSRAVFGFDKELTRLRGEISRSETRLRDELEASQKALESIKTASLSGAASRHQAIENKRIEAAQAIWNAVVDLSKLRYAAELAGSLELAEVAKRITNGDAKMRQFMDMIVQPIAIDKLPETDTARHRPFITESVWAAYSAYSTILHISLSRLKMAQVGMTDADDMLTVDALNKIIATALPQHEEFIKEHGVAGYHMLIDELENLVLSSIKNMLESKETDAALVERNVEILKAVNSVQAKVRTALS